MALLSLKTYMLYNAKGMYIYDSLPPPLPPNPPSTYNYKEIMSPWSLPYIVDIIGFVGSNVARNGPEPIELRIRAPFHRNRLQKSRKRFFF